MNISYRKTLNSGSCFSIFFFLLKTLIHIYIVHFKNSLNQFTSKELDEQKHTCKNIDSPSKLIISLNLFGFIIDWAIKSPSLHNHSFSEDLNIINQVTKVFHACKNSFSLTIKLTRKTFYFSSLY